jgi:hypothetical protein
VTTPVKRVGSKPAAVSIITSKKPRPVTTATTGSKPKPASGTSTAQAQKAKHVSKKANTSRATSGAGNVSSTTKSSNSKKLLKSIFSPVNSSDSEIEKLGSNSKNSSAVGAKTVKRISSKKKPAGSTSEDAKAKKKIASPAPNPVSSSSLSGT